MRPSSRRTRAQRQWSGASSVLLAALFALGGFACTACRGQQPAQGTALDASQSGSGRATSATGDGSSAAPGAPEQADARSAIPETLCKEHGVLEAVCTKCNPGLVPVFQAKGDWCAEHGFPESFCPICHPEKRGRPERDVDASNEAPADGTRVMFKSPQSARMAGLRTVEATKGSGDTDLVVTARIVYDAAKVARVNARAPGVLQAVRVDIGARVRAGAALAVIESAGVGADQSRLQAARSRLALAEANYTRSSKLHRDGIVPEIDVLAARRELDDAKADLDAAQTALGMVGGTKEGASRYTLFAPIAGVVTSRQATIGRMVDTEEILFEIVDTSTMWAEIDIPETDAGRIGTGQRVSVEVDGMDGRELSGVLSFIAPEIDPHTRTATGRISLANPDGALRANMYARARIRLSGSRASVLVPREAVQRARGAQLVFVRLGEQAYEVRRVVSGPSEGDLVQIAGRIAPGDRVVTEGSFLLKTETLKESIGAGCCEVEPPR